MNEGNSQVITGWGRTSPSRTRLIGVQSEDELRRALARADDRGVIGRGLGRSYGDAAQNSGGTTIVLSSSDIYVDVATGVVDAAGGASIDSLLQQTIPEGWFVPVTPGTRFVTVGGAIAADVHGKNHHRDGSIGHHLVDLTMMVASGEVVVVDRERDSELFWATIGGMGLTGIILRARLRMIPIETSSVSVRTERHSHLEDLMASMESNDESYRYAVAWVDGSVGGSRLGRGIVTYGEHATIDMLPTLRRSAPLDYRSPRVVNVPEFMSRVRPLRRSTAVAFSELWFRKAPKQRVDELVSIPSYFHTLDGVGKWNRLYGPRGFIQHQCVVPLDAPHAVRAILERVVRDRPANVVNVLKRFGSGNAAPLSFPRPGWTLTVDIPVTDDLVHTLRDIDTIVGEWGGRHYLAKDATATSRSIRSGYERLAEWQAVRNRVDPHRVWQSDLGRRLDLCAG